MIFDVCFYHGNCVDGTLSAAIAELAFPDITLIPLYRRDSLLVDESIWKNKNVLMADFSLTEDIMDELNHGSKNFLLLDHHVSAFKKLGSQKYAKFNMNLSGAQMVWAHFFPDKPEPKLLNICGNSDRGIRLSAEADAVLDYLYQFDLEPHTWKNLMLEFDAKENEFIEKGFVVQSWKQNVVKNTAATKAFKTVLANEEVWAINSALFKNELASLLYTKSKFSIVYYGQDGKFYWSLRSPHGGFDVEKIAAKNGGGGHKNAAAFVAEYAPIKINEDKFGV